MLSRFHPIPERYGQTDGQTDRRTEFLYQYRASVCWRAIKTAFEVLYYWRNEANYFQTRSIARPLCDSRASCFLPRDAMHSADYAVGRRLSVCLCVCPSHAGILSKRLNISSNFFTIGLPHHYRFSTPNAMAILRREPPKGGGGASARGMKKSRFSTNVLPYLRNDAR